MTTIRDAETIEGEDEAKVGLKNFVNVQANSMENQNTETVFQLFHVKGANQNPLDAHSFELTDDVDEFVDAVWDDAVKDAETRRGTSKYLLRPCKVDEKNPTKFVPLAKGRFAFKVVVHSEMDTELDFSDADIEDAAPKGLLAQKMRHTEKAYAHALQQSVVTQSQTQSIMDMQKDMINELRKENKDLKETYEEALSMNLKRQLEYDEHKRNMERKDKMVEMLSGILPIVVQHFLTQSAGGATAEAASRFAQLMQTLQPDQKQALMMVLSPDQQAALNTILQGAQGGGGGMLGSLVGALGSGL